VVDSPAETDVLRTPAAGGMVIRGGAIRAGGYGASILLAAVTSVLLLRYLGVEAFGLYGVVAALLGIVASLTEGGLSVVGARDLALAPAGEPRRRLLGNLLLLRIVLTSAGVAAAAAFALAAGYRPVVVGGTLLAGLGVLLLNAQVTVSLPLRVQLRMGAVTGVEVLNQAATLALVALLVVLGAPLLAFFGVQVAVGALAVVVTALLVGGALSRPLFDRDVLRPLVREALPVAAAVAMNVVYLRLLVVLVSLIATELATGLFATSFRVFEMLVGLPTLVLSIALPALAVHLADDRERFAYGLQRLTEVALLVGLFQALVVVSLAEPAVVLLYGEEYRGAGPILAVQALTLVPIFLAQTWTLGLIALRRQQAVAIANGVALAFVLGVGSALVLADGADGAAWAAVATESLLAVLLLAALARSARDVMPRFGFAWRPLAAAAVGVVPLLALDRSGWVEGPLAAIAFAVVALAVRAVPAEILPALRGGRR
jgi:O-antigen/teichoic acid export membrane protein